MLLPLISQAINGNEQAKQELRELQMGLLKQAKTLYDQAVARGYPGWRVRWTEIRIWGLRRRARALDQYKIWQ